MAKWKSNGLVIGRSRFLNQVDALVPFGKVLIHITTSLAEVLKPSVP